MEQKNLRWMRLDNAGKIFPAARRKKWVNIFRLSVNLKEQIDLIILQKSLNNIIKRFPSIAVRLKKGMFWYYLEEIPEAPKILKDKAYPASIMPFKDIKKCAFRVLYYENRIAVEFFHALTDGSGGLVFLKTLTAEYLKQKHNIQIVPSNGVLDINEHPLEEELEDSFPKYAGNVSASRKEDNAFKLKGTKEPDDYLNNITGIINTTEILKLAKSYNVSLTIFLTAVMIVSLDKIQKERVSNPKKYKPIKVMIPVNLRNMFDSKTLRNFALYITPRIDPKMGDYTFEEIIKSVYYQMGADLTSKKMATRITTNVKTEKTWLVKILPLFIKNFAMKSIYDMVGEKKSCLNISNLGKVTIPLEMEKYIDRFDFLLGIQAVLTNNCSVVSFKNQLVINFVRNIKEPKLEYYFFSYLKNLGLNIKIESNQR